MLYQSELHPRTLLSAISDHSSCANSLPPHSLIPRPIDDRTLEAVSNNGGGRIRTYVGVCRQIYSLLPLATRAPHRAQDRPCQQTTPHKVGVDIYEERHSLQAI